MKKIYIVLLVILLAGSGVGVLVWSKKKEKKEDAPIPIVEIPEPTPNPIESNPIEPKIIEPKPIGQKTVASNIKPKIPAKLLTDISIDYIKPYSLEMGYNMHYKGISHQGTFKHGDRDTFIKKSLASFSVTTLNLIKEIERGVSSKGGKLKGYNGKELELEEPIVYLFIINKSEVVKGLKVNLRTGDQIEGLPKDWSEFDGLD